MSGENYFVISNPYLNWAKHRFQLIGGRPIVHKQQTSLHKKQDFVRHVGYLSENPYKLFSDFIHVPFFPGIFRSLILHTECHFSEIYKSPLGGDDLFYVASSVFLKHASCPNAIASNPAEKKLYWTDLTFKHIARVNLDGTQEEVIVQNVGNSLALAVDSYGGNIYFTDKDTRTVEVAKLDGSNRKVLIRNSTHQPVGLAIDSSRGYGIFSKGSL